MYIEAILILVSLSWAITEFAKSPLLKIGDILRIAVLQVTKRDITQLPPTILRLFAGCVGLVILLGVQTFELPADLPASLQNLYAVKNATLFGVVGYENTVWWLEAIDYVGIFVLCSIGARGVNRILSDIENNKSIITAILKKIAGLVSED